MSNVVWLTFAVVEGFWALGYNIYVCVCVS